jgi:hypothetical protein
MRTIAAVMVRFFLYEMGLKLKQGTRDTIEPIRGKDWEKVVDQVEPPFSITRLTVEDIKSAGLFDEVCEVLRLANRAVAHIDAEDVDHDFKNDEDNQRIFQVIDFVELMVKKKIYEDNGEDYDLRMNDSRNDMARTCLVELVKKNGLMARYN